MVAKANSFQFSRTQKSFKVSQIFNNSHLFGANALEAREATATVVHCALLLLMGQRVDPGEANPANQILQLLSIKLLLVSESDVEQSIYFGRSQLETGLFS
jgi:hypothetical protein